MKPCIETVPRVCISDVIAALGARLRDAPHHVRITLAMPGGEPVEFRVRLRYTRTRMGGKRAYLACDRPGCRATRRDHLFLGPDGHLGCRRCLGLLYVSQRHMPVDASRGSGAGIG